ncbi:DNA cytosine methyltransferase [Shinella yambaruensis]|uniref:DNA (cytosine-5-)-methyltransferase n=1 Tax=Shinella yambaruensis TaxID=415996 RepID=A0ABQ5ZSS0_9HYPH|nr:DNA cytosine methyltransferase [Shinella yambaruensis]MCJ8029953.1 DNA cytosine methyltransferase [Shinella yambaruensis]MCU7984206.1 DNA cytosine methyltransferase [Shinella yambaruensis]GLR55200.1 DNA methyltransferase [Shinella yambaruensis]
MNTTAIDLFAGFGGFTAGAKAAGVHVLWAANHWPSAVEWHTVNHPDAIHVCQDLHQANWGLAPAHDMLLASPCCQGHSPARGRANGNPQHDTSRATAWAVVSAAEYHRPPVLIVENVPEFTRWALYPAWLQAMGALGYQCAPHIVDCADLGVPQNRVRLFLVCTKSKNPLLLQLPQYPHVPASSFIRWDSGKWSPIRKAGRSAATKARIGRGWRALGKGRFLIPYYGSGSGLTGRSVERPIGTITTIDRWALVKGNKMRMLNADEVLAAQSFPEGFKRPTDHRLTVHMAGNAVPPLAAQRVIETVLRAA